MIRRILAILLRAGLLVALSASIGLLAVGFGPAPAQAGAVLDADGDLIPDPFDNCSTRANGPNQGTNQVDVDLDGYGAVTPSAFGIFLSYFEFSPPGPSGLACADPTIQTLLGDAPCLP